LVISFPNLPAPPNANGAHLNNTPERARLGRSNVNSPANARLNPSPNDWFFRVLALGNTPSRRARANGAALFLIAKPFPPLNALPSS